MNRQDLQQLSRLRARDAKALLVAGNYAGAYYIAGYSVECAIKAAIAKQTQRHDFPNKRVAQDSWSHDLKQLLQTAGLWSTIEAATKANQDLALNWAVAKDWSEASRYVLTTSQQQAIDLYSACTARTHGLLSWLKNYW
jgi:HEPN domain-containing protein